MGKGCNGHSKRCRRRQPLVNSDRRQRCVPGSPIPGHPQFNNVGGTYSHAVGRTQLTSPSCPPCESLCGAVAAIELSAALPLATSSAHTVARTRAVWPFAVPTEPRRPFPSAAAVRCTLYWYCKRPTIY